MNLRSCLLVCLLSISTISYSQWSRAIYNVPLVVPPSPTSASLGIYGVFPVSYYSGTPQIGIPIFEIKEGEITVPINVSYHASGIRVEDVASWVGLGWSFIFARLHLHMAFIQRSLCGLN
jgi:hypothetical protein